MQLFCSYHYNSQQEIGKNMSEEIRLTRDIHNFVRGKLSWDESLGLLDEILDSDEWLNHLELDMIIYHIACKKRKMKGTKPSFPTYD